MKITTVRRGNIGGGLGELWTKTGHEVTAIARDGGDVSSADVVLIAVPGTAVGDALAGIQGLGGKTGSDATNIVNAEPPNGFASNAELIKAQTGWTDREIVQPQLRCPIRPAHFDEGAARERLVRRRSRARGD